MINPQLMGLNNLDNVPTTKDLWKNEKQKYRHWMILFGIGLLAVFAFYSIGFIINLIEKQSIMTKLVEHYKDLNSKNPEQMANSFWVQNFVIFPSFIISSLFIGIILYIVTIIKSYLKHSFAHFSMWLIYIVGFGALFSFINLVTILSDVNFWMQWTGSIFILITLILFIVFYFTTATKVSRIRRQFAYSEYIQKLRSDERFMKFQQNLQNSMYQTGNSPISNPFGPQILNPQSEGIQQNKAINQNVPIPIDIKMHKQYTKLSAMALDKLKEIGKKLSISGAESMQKDELIETIIRVSKKD